MPRPRKRRQYKTGSVSQRGGSWQVRWYEGTRQRSQSFTDRELAERALSIRLGEKAAGRAGVERDRRKDPSLDELAQDWLKRRKATHQAQRDDFQRWRDHLEPIVGHLQPHEVGRAHVRQLVQRLLAKTSATDDKATLSSTTVRNCVRLLSVLYTELVDEGFATANPAKELPRDVARLIRVAHDPKTTPFLEQAEHVRKVYARLPDHVAVGFALGFFAMLRTAEVMGLRWEHVHLDRKQLHVCQQRRGSRVKRLKDRDSRFIPIADELLPLLTAWKLRTGGAGWVVPSAQRPTRPIGEHALGEALAEALKGAELPHLTWYEATRHSGASHWAMAGGDIKELSLMMGHESVLTTERHYVHLRPDRVRPTDAARMKIALPTRAAPVLPMPISVAP